MQDSGADLLEAQPAGAGNELEKQFSPVTKEELVRFRTFTASKGGWTAETKALLKKDDPNTFAEFRDIDKRRQQELDPLRLPSELTLLRETSATFVDDQGGFMKDPPSFELEEWLQQVKMWQKKWGGSEEQKLALYQRLEQLEALYPESVTGAPDEEKAKKNVEDMESESRRITQELDKRIETKKRVELQQLFDQKGHGGLELQLPELYFGEERPEDQKTWDQLRKSQQRKYEVMRRLYEQYANELRSIEPPISLDYYEVADKEPDLKGVDTSKIQDLFERTKKAQEDWNKLSDEEKKSRLNRIAELRNINSLHRRGLGKYDTGPEHSFENFEVTWWSGALERQGLHLGEEIKRRNVEAQEALDKARVAREEMENTHKDVLEGATEQDSQLNQKKRPVVTKKKKRFGIF